MKKIVSVAIFGIGMNYYSWETSLLRSERQCQAQDCVPVKTLSLKNAIFE